jgi:uncharacterized membrane protein YccC
MSDIEKQEEEMNPEDGMVAGLTLWLRTLFEEWAQSFKLEVFEAVKDAVRESDIVSDIEYRLDELAKNAKAIHDEAVTHKELQEKLDEATNDVRIAAIEANIEELTETVSGEVAQDVLAKQEKLEKFFEMASEFFA